MDNNKDKTQEFEEAVDKLSETMKTAIEESQEKVFNLYTAEAIEEHKLLEEIRERDKNDDGTRYTSDDVINMRNDIKQFVQDNLHGTDKNYADIRSNILSKYRTLENAIKGKEEDTEESELKISGLVNALLAKQVVNNAYKEAFKEEDNKSNIERKGESNMRNFIVSQMLGKEVEDLYFDPNQIHIELEDNTTISLTADTNSEGHPVLKASVSYSHTREGNI